MAGRAQATTGCGGASPEGVLLADSQWVGVHEYQVFPTEDGGFLAVTIPGDHDEPSRTAAPAAFSAWLPDASTLGEGGAMVRFSIAFADAEGALWQADGESGAFRFWDQALDAGLYVRGEEPRPKAAATETERVIFADVHGYFDGRDRRYVGVHRPDAEAQDGWSTLLFEVREKYFGYRMSLVERRGALPESRLHALILGIEVDVPAIARIHGYQQSLPTPSANLRLLAPLVAPAIHPPVSLNELTRPLRKADSAAWLTAAREAGMAESTIARVLRPNRCLTWLPTGS